jgi:1-pyrroline-5-carboxylate dehydrogenase
MEKITHATLTPPGEDFHRAFETALSHERKKLGATHPLFIAGRAVTSKGGTFALSCPADTRVLLGRFQRGTREHAHKAMAAARAAATVWRELGWPQRVAFLRKMAEVISRHPFELAALLTLETGQTRVEAAAEVAETSDAILYYAHQMELHQGYALRLSGANTEQTRSVLRPFGVWAILSSFNAPLARATGTVAAALLGGNTVVLKPSSDTPGVGLRMHDLFHHAGLPVGVFNVVTGAGEEVAAALAAHSELDGLAFAGTRAVGLKVWQSFTQGGSRPCLADMGGKSPAVIMPTANLEDAAEGVLRSAFGVAGQQCSACARAYVHKQVYKAFLGLLVEKTRALKVGDPAARDVSMGPLINAAAVARFKQAVALGRKEGRLVQGGAVLKSADCARGHFVEPTIFDQLPMKSELLREEWLVPILAVTEVKSLGEAITLANNSPYGLAAGVYTQIEEEQIEFFERIEAGTVFCNRRAGATTGAWPGVQSFGGWKASTSTARHALGPYYVSQFLREQSQTVGLR